MASNNNSILIVNSLWMTLLLLLPSATPVRTNDIVAAIEEMQRANYFTFVMLINMSPPDPRLEANVTFLMPKDQMLAKMAMPERSVSDFLLQHSIPSPLLLETLEKFPTGTTVPSSLPNYMLRITNNGRRNFVLNNVKIISPNICVSGSSIRCHGIDGVLSEVDVSARNSCTSNNSTEASSSCMASSPSSSSPPSPFAENQSPPTFTAPIPIEADSGTQNSGSFDGSLSYFVSILMLIFVGINF
ncbi:FAS1 domain-containing protein SELMODRAFT_448915-like [Neltuma alba]|uniref:FAS1 domain-containing protein SELMODRAFT_448915-like n=1 Tax=Neltuma alba TaxID=207710 RepID=UPI0010A52901|nr:FAS1 domain-containing protein SELMODRAFT_448915-like [Prosopis alba]